MNKLRIKRFTEDAILPTRAHPTDAGLDLYSSENITIAYGERVKINTHIGVALFEGQVGLILDRSSIANKGIRTLGGVIDANYRGEIQIILAYVGLEDLRTDDLLLHLLIKKDDPINIQRGDKIAQLIITAAYTPEVIEVNEFETTDRGSNGFGSSGR